MRVKAFNSIDHDAVVSQGQVNLLQDRVHVHKHLQQAVDEVPVSGAALQSTESRLQVLVLPQGFATAFVQCCTLRARKLRPGLPHLRPVHLDKVREQVEPNLLGPRQLFPLAGRSSLKISGMTSSVQKETQDAGSMGHPTVAYIELQMKDLNVAPL